MGCLIENNILTYSWQSPKILYIEVTKACNLSCHHCFNESSPNLMHKTITLSNAKNIVNFALKDNKVKKIVISGGELFYLDNAIELIKCFNGGKIQILTNGTLLKARDIKYIVKNNINIQITLNGHNEYIDNLTRNNAFDKTCQTIKQFAEENIKLVTVSYTIHKGNAKYIKDFIDFCVNTYHVKNIQFAFIGCLGRAAKIWEEFNLPYLQKIEIINELLILKKTWENVVKISFSGISELLLKYAISAKNATNTKQELYCDEYSEEMQINYDLSLEGCPKVSKYINCKKLQKIFLEDINKKEFSWKFSELDDCYNCNYYKTGGCVTSCSQKTLG